MKKLSILVFIALFFLCFGCTKQINTRGSGQNETAGEAQSGELELEVFPQLGHSDTVTSIAFSPDSKTVVSGSKDNTIKLWDTSTSRLINTISSEHYNYVTFVVFNPDGKTIASLGFWDNEIKLWDTATGREINTFSGHTNPVLSLVFSPDGKTVVSRSRDETVKLWDAATGQELRTLLGHTDSVASVAFSPNGKIIISGSDDKTIKIWDAITGQEIRTLLGHTDSVASVAFSPNGNIIISGSTDETIRLWDTDTGLEIRKFSNNSDGKLVFSPDGKIIASESSDNTIKLWDVDTGLEIQTFSNHLMSFNSLAFSPDSKTVVSGEDNTIKLWDVDTGLELNTLTGHSHSVWSTAFNSDGKTVVAGSAEGTIKIWDIITGLKVHTFQGHSNSFVSTVFSPDGKSVVSESGDETIKIWDAMTGKEIRTLSGHSGTVSSLAFSPDGKTIASGSWKIIKLWDAATGRELCTLSGHSNWVNSVAFSPNGKTIVSGSIEVKFWDVETGRELHSFPVTVLASSVAFNPDGKSVVLGLYCDSIKLIDTVTGKEIRAFPWHSLWVNSVAFSPDGKTVISGGDNTIKLCDVATGRQMHTFSGHLDNVCSIAFSPDGKQIISASKDGTIRLWDVATGKEIAAFISFSGSDSQLISASRDLIVETETVASSIDGEWVVITPDGYYASSPRGDRYLNVRIGNTVTGIDSFRSIFYNPDVVRARLNGEPDPSAKKSVTIQQAAAFMPPDVTVQTQNRASSSSSADISVSITDKNLPLKNIIVMVNGRRLGKDELAAASGASGLKHGKASITVTGYQKTLNFSLPVNLDPGDNRIEVVAFNGFSENRRYVDISWDAPAGNKSALPDLWILAIGVNKYDNAGKQLGNLRNLDYCVADAQGVIESLKAQEGVRYGKVHSLLISDDAKIKPTAANIRKHLKFLEGAGPKDVALLFLAGHGMSAAEGKFYFLPKDAVVSKGNNVTVSRAISGDEIVAVLDAPGNRLVFIDACKSGGVDNDRMVRLFMDTNAFVFAACRGNESSLELPNLGHGVFTYSVMDALKGAAGARAADNVSVKSMSGFVQIDVPERTDNRQHPSAYSLGFYDFPITVINVSR